MDELRDDTVRGVVRDTHRRAMRDLAASMLCLLRDEFVSREMRMTAWINHGYIFAEWRYDNGVRRDASSAF